MMLPVEEYGQVKNTKGVIKWKYVPKDTIVKTIGQNVCQNILRLMAVVMRTYIYVLQGYCLGYVLV